MPADAASTTVARRRRLVQRRKALGLTQEALAELMAVGRSTVVRWERGESEPLPWIRPKLAWALKVSADLLESLLAADDQRGDTTAPRQLPAAVADFTGRAVELQRLTQVLEAAKASRPGTVLISVIGGMAGVGKTALALHWAHRVAGRFPDGQLYVNLRGFDPSGTSVTAPEAIRGFLNALEVAPERVPASPEAQAGLYRSLLADRRMLIVLDNARDTEQLRLLLPGSSSSYVLVTSRDNLSGLVARHGARRLELDLLPMPEAALLLRALLDPRLAVDPDTLATVAGQCGRLPLAVRIAAEFLDARPGAQLRELAAELSGALHPLDLFDLGGDPSCSIRSVFSWSYRQLDRTAARAFLLIGRQPATGFARAALEAGGELDPTEVRHALDVLVRGHLVQQVAAGQYRMHPLLHDYAAELAGSARPESGRTEPAKARLAKAELARPERAALAPTPPPELSVLPPELAVLPAVEPHLSRHPDSTDRRPTAPVWRG